tara:strand:- start:2819 stop:3409 length:591 start_codon:yes stop_codon:yes gene_type:complete
MITLIQKILAAIGFVLLLPLIAISVLLILIEDGFPLFFIQDRLGKNMKKFKIYKIRTMHNETPNLGTHEVSTDNYLKTGSFLRKLKIDELPQILNYLKGDLNLIGPRPGLPSQSKLKEIRLAKDIFDVKPGITGLSQVLGYDMEDPLTLSKVDNIYIKKRNIRIDLLIFLATFIKPLRSVIPALFIDDIVNTNKRK